MVRTEWYSAGTAHVTQDRRSLLYYSLACPALSGVWAFRQFRFVPSPLPCPGTNSRPSRLIILKVGVVERPYKFHQDGCSTLFLFRASIFINDVIVVYSLLFTQLTASTGTSLLHWPWLFWSEFAEFWQSSTFSNLQSFGSFEPFDLSSPSSLLRAFRQSTKEASRRYLTVHEKGKKERADSLQCLAISSKASLWSSCGSYSE